jgi:hypothetical protein
MKVLIQTATARVLKSGAMLDGARAMRGSGKPGLRQRNRPGRVRQPAGAGQGIAQRSSVGLPGHSTTLTPNRVSVCAGNIRAMPVRLRSCAGEVDRVSWCGCPEAGSSDGELGFGVWLFFENSTGCLISQCQLVIPWPCFLWGLGFLWRQMFVAGVSFQVFVGEFDPGSGRTLAACLTHASRAERPFWGYSSGERVSNT